MLKPVFCCFFQISCLFLSGLAIFSTANAAYNQRNAYVGLEMGMGIPTGKSTDTYIDQTGFENIHQFQTNKLGLTARYGLHAGLSLIDPAKRWFPGYRFELGFWQNTDFTAKGLYTSTIQGAPTPDESEFYQYKIGMWGIGLNNSVILYRWRGMEPFIGTGINLAFLKASGFNYTEIPGQTPSPLSFANHSTTRALFDINTGLRYVFLKNWDVQFLYQYMLVGKVKLGAGQHGDAQHAPPVYLAPFGTALGVHNLLVGVNYRFK